jgi:predicted kinase
MKNKLILVSGHSAAGKSTFAFKLSQTLGIPFMSKDTLREAIGDGFTQGSGLMNDKGFLPATINVMMYFAECFLQIEKVCILEANFRPPHDEQILALLEKYNADCLTFLFNGDMEVFWERYEKRETERHWVHHFPGQCKDLFINGGLKAGFGEFAIGNTVTIDATDFNKIDYDGLYNIASQFISS